MTQKKVLIVDDSKLMRIIIKKILSDDNLFVVTGEAGNGIEATITGDKSLSSRPMLRIKEPLEQMGAKIELTGNKQTLPMRVLGGNLLGICLLYTSDAADE